MSRVGKGVRSTLRRLAGGRIVRVKGEAGAPFAFRLAEFPSLLRGPARAEPEMTPIWRALLREGDVIFDVGANIGLTTHRFAGILGGRCRIVCFEPLPRNLELLRQNTAALPPGVARIEEAAVGDHDGTVQFTDNLEHGALSRLSHFDSVEGAAGSYAELWDSTQRIEVRLRSLDSFVAAEPALAPSFVKIDVEGAGAFVLAGAKEVLRVHRPVLSVSFHAGGEREAMTAAAAAAGYVGLLVHRDGSTTPVPAERSEGTFVHAEDARFGRPAAWWHDNEGSR